MKLLVNIGSINGEIAGPELFEALCAVNPEARQYPEQPIKWQWFNSSLDQGDSRNNQLLLLLEKAGWQAHPKRGEKGPHEFALTYIRQYEPPDFDDLRLIQITPKVNNEGLSRTINGWVRFDVGVNLQPFNHTADFADAFAYWIVVPDRVKRLIATERWSGLSIKPTVVRDEDQNYPEGVVIPWEQFGNGEPWWEISSDATMPPLSSSMPMFDRFHKPLKDRGDFSKGVFIEHGLHRPIELHYCRAHINMMEPIDFALTFEGFGGGGDMPALIVSKRFYDFCERHNLTVDWVPVRIDT